MFEAQDAAVLKPTAPGPGETSFVTPAREFELGFVELSPGHAFVAAGGRLEILLQLTGSTRLKADGRETALERGQSVLVPAAVSSYELEGSGRLARARVPA